MRAPRTWGWTGPEQIDELRALESPTHVGMDRGAPRARSRPELRAPRTWGWTALEEIVTVVVAESPTHVGMDRSTWMLGMVSAREPHARGDGPPAAVCGRS